MRRALAILLLAVAARAQEPAWTERIRTEIEAAKRAHTGDEDALAAPDEALARADVVLQRLGTEAERLEARLDARTSVSQHAGDLLMSALRRFRSARQRLDSHTLPQVVRSVAKTQGARLAVQDRLWELELALEDGESLPTGVTRDQYRRAVPPLVRVLRERATTLEKTEVKLAALETKYREQRKFLTSLTALVLSRSYWLRTDPPLGPEVLRRARDEVGSLGRAVGRTDWSKLSVTIVAALIALAGAAVFLAFRVRRLQRRWAFRGGALWQGTQRTAVAVLVAALVPAVLLAMLAVVRASDAFGQPVLTLIGWTAWLWFLRALLWRLLRPGGVATKEWKMPDACAAVLLRNAQLGTLGALLFLGPAEALREQPLGFSHLPRLLYTGYLFSVIAAMLLTLPPGGPVIAAWTRKRGAVYRLRGVLVLPVGLFLLMIVGMHVAGFRLGADLLLANAIETLAVVFMLTGLYKLLKRVVSRLASRVQRQALKEEANRDAAREQSQAVTDQLTRVVTVAVLVATAALLMRFWDVDTNLRELLAGARIYAGTSVVLTIWDIVKAIVWVAAGHFVVANLSGLYEFLIIPLIGRESQGGRFVFIALTRYAILLIAYSAAVLSLHFSFSSLGWMLAAMSVGLGFGLQEVVANFVSGLILLLERPIRVGDIVTVGDTGGVVDRITIRATVVTNWDRQVIIVPNKRFITEEVTNWTRNDSVMRRKVQVGVRYGSDVAQVLRILQEIVAAHPAVVAEPQSRVWFDSFGDSSLDFEIWFFAEVMDGRQAVSEIRASIAQRFADEGVEIPFPQRDLHLRSVDEVAAAALLRKKPKAGA